MSRTILIVVGILSPFIAADSRIYADDPPTVIKQELSFEKLPQTLNVNLGQFKVGENVQLVIALSNKTGKKLKLSDIESDCNCAVAEVAHQEFAVNGQNTLTAVLESPTMAGRFGRLINLRFADHGTTPLRVIARGSYDGPVKISPQVADFTKGNVAELVAETKRGWSISRVASVGGGILVSNIAQDSEGYYRIKVRSKQGLAREVDKLAFSLAGPEGKQQVVVPIQIRVPPIVKSIPSTLRLARQGEGWEGRTRLFCRDTDAMNHFHEFAIRVSGRSLWSRKLSEMKSTKVSGRVLDLIVKLDRIELESLPVDAEFAGFDKDGKLVFSCDVRKSDLGE